jgi:hypothetical protein
MIEKRPAARNTPRSTIAHVALMISLVLALGVMVAGIILVDWRLIAAPIPAWVALAILVAAGYAIADRRTPPQGARDARAVLWRRLQRSRKPARAVRVRRRTRRPLPAVTAVPPHPALPPALRGVALP